MDVYVLTQYSSISRSGEYFVIKNPEKEQSLSPHKIKTILVSSKCSITSDAIVLANKNNIDIIVLDEYGNPYGRFWYCRFGSTAKIRYAQIMIFNEDAGLDIAKNWILEKIDSSINHLKKLEYKRKDKSEFISGKIDGLKFYKQKINELSGNKNEVKDRIRGYEGNAGKTYYQTISELLPSEYKFSNRTTRPAKDPYNAFINYGFGILYSKVEKAIIVAGLDPFVGIIHSDDYAKKSLVFDMIESYRYLVWETAFSLFSRKQVNQSHYDKKDGGVSLNKEGKKLISVALGEKLVKKVEYKNKMASNYSIIQQQCHDLSNYLIKQISTEEEVSC